MLSYRLESYSTDSFASGTQVVPIAEIDRVINLIEIEVGSALKEIANIQGIDSIDKCKDILTLLEQKLY